VREGSCRRRRRHGQRRSHPSLGFKNRFPTQILTILENNYDGALLELCDASTHSGTSHATRQDARRDFEDMLADGELAGLVVGLLALAGLCSLVAFRFGLVHGHKLGVRLA
jgi:hypothetical protein